MHSQKAPEKERLSCCALSDRVVAAVLKQNEGVLGSSCLSVLGSLQVGDLRSNTLTRVLCGNGIAQLQELIQVRLVNEGRTSIDKPRQTGEGVLSSRRALSARLLMM